MAYTSIDDPTIYFNTILWTGSGNSSPRSFTGVGFQPDWVWYKCRSDTYNHNFVDVVRGTGLNSELCSNKTSIEGGGDSSTHGYLSSFDTDGFSSANGSSNNLEFNQSGDTFVAWNWKAGGSASSNSNGSITSSVSANTTVGFSIVSYTGTGSQATVGHGLGVAPSVLIHKKRTTSAEAWSVFHQSVGITKRMILSSTEAETADASPQPDWNDVLPTSSVFTIGTSSRTNASENYICYAFAEKKGYSKFGSYTGNGNADGTFVYTGFKPAFLIVKRTDSAGYDWLMYDNKRQVSFNVIDDFLKPNLSDTETTGNANQSLDFLSNGIKFRGNGASSNGSGATYIYMAFAESPFVNSKGVPNNSR